jgi:eukaryotic-like serine/threonine-protein kinase
MVNSARDAETLSASAPLARAPAASELLAVEPERYQEQAMIGQGGGGRLLRAWDQRLERVVAIKVLRKLSNEQEARFRREALVTARLQHPGIVPVHEIGRWSTGEPYYAMKLVSGESLRDVLEHRPALRDRLPMIANLLMVAETVAFAHSERIIHRDLTPANIMLGAFGETVVVDWGLAKDLRCSDTGSPIANDPIEDVTVSGVVMGTPAYMAPEQALAQRVDQRTDVYALGAVLYRVLAGRTPYGPGSNEEIIAAVARESPAPLAPRAADAPGELIAIAEKAMARAPEERYPDAGALARDLKRFLDGQLVDAHRYTVWKLACRFVARHRSMVALATVFVIALAVSGAYSVHRVVGERGRAEQARVVAEESRSAAEVSRAAAEARTDDLLLAQARLLVEKKPTEALAYLKSYAAASRPDWPAVWAIAADARSKIVARDVFRGLHELRIASDARHLAGVDEQGRLMLVDLATNEATVMRGASKVTSLALRPRALAAVSADRNVWRWELPQGTSTPLGVVDGEPIGIMMSNDAHYVAVPVTNGTIYVFDPRGTRRVLHGHTASIAFFAFSPDGTLGVSTGHDLVTYLWSLDDGQPRARIDVQGWGVTFSPDGQTIAIAGEDSLVWLVDVATGKRRSLAGHTDRVNQLVFAADGRTLYSSSVDQTVRVWNLATGASRVLKGHQLTVETLAASSDGRFLASASDDQTIRVWDLALGESRTLLGHDDHVGEMVFTPDSRSLVSVDAGGQARVWDLPAPPVLAPTGGQVDELATSGDGTVWAMGADRLRALASDGTERARYDTPGIRIRVATSEDGRYAATAAKGGLVLLFKAGVPKPIVLRGHHGDANVLAFAPDGQMLVSAGDDHVIRLWRTADGKLERTLEGHTKAVWVLEISPDGKRLFSGGDEHGGRLWDLEHGTSRVLPAVDMVYSASFSGDGKLLAWSAGDSTVRLLSLADGSIRAFGGHRAVTRMVGLSPDGTVLATGSDDHTVRVCTLRDDHCIVLDDDGPIGTLRFSRDGRRLLTNNSTHTARIWDVATGAELLVAHGDPTAIEVALSADAKHVFASFEHEPYVRVWAIDAPPPEASSRWLAQLSSVTLAPNGDVVSPLAIR